MGWSNSWRSILYSVYLISRKISSIFILFQYRSFRHKNAPSYIIFTLSLWSKPLRKNNTYSVFFSFQSCSFYLTLFWRSICSRSWTKWFYSYVLNLSNCLLYIIIMGTDFFSKCIVNDQKNRRSSLLKQRGLGDYNQRS